MPRIRIGIDIGGTFTDVVGFDEANGIQHIVKLPTTPHDQSVAAVEGIRRAITLLEGTTGDIRYFSHGTTVGTNAVLEHRLARTALITTRGFRDVLEIGRQRRPKQYDFTAEKSPPVVTRALRFEVTERVGPRGEVIAPLKVEEVAAVARELRARSVTSVAVCLLFSFLNPAHEQQIADILARELPEAAVFLSSDVLPEYREYERTSTVALSAAVAPVLTRYVENLEGSLRGAGLGCELYLMKSTGGIMPFRAVGRHAVETVLSGPAAGAIGVGNVGQAMGLPRVIGFDMGGTSTDVSMVIEGHPRTTSEGQIGEYPLRVPIIDIRTIGAGGGSIAWLDVADILHVGPESAGAVPGPACYGRGGERPTVTDANLVLGKLNPRHFLGGDMALLPDAALAAVEGHVGRQMGREAAAAAQGIIDIVNSNMGRAIREISVANGYDVREFALMTFGGAGALHACSLAEELEIPLVVVPTDAGLLSAKGLLVSDIKSDFSVSRIAPAAEWTPDLLERTFAELEERARRELTDEGIDTTNLAFRRAVDMRYRGQVYEVAVAEEPGPVEKSIDRLVAGFHAMHRQLYWWADPGRPVEIVNLRITAVVETPKVPLPRAEPRPGGAERALLGQRPVLFRLEDGFVDTPIYRREDLAPGDRIEGPAIIEAFDTTIAVNPGYQAEIDEYANVLIRLRA